MNRFGRLGDVLLAVGAIAVTVMIVVPLPTFLLDVLLSVNISIAFVLLVVSLYVPGAVQLSTFPAILLLTTLFRLALNVSSTRLILLQADAGRVIDAFGHVVVQGNYVVGAVVFAILTIIQFIVVARGAERVSEVAARFTLDAMPGRQLAIDADLRSGALALDEARLARAELQRESQLFGALDGAMKFVKGDAIAAVLLIGINVVAGIIVGVVQLGMPLSEALKTYTILTVGDGLVSQIPALLIATAAGIIVTRVASSEQRPLGEEIARQIGVHHRALTIAAVLLVGLSLVPGLPTLPFLAVGVTLGLLGRASRTVARAGAPTKGEGPVVVVPPLTRLELHIPEALQDQIDADPDSFDAGVRRLRQNLAFDLGLTVPQIRVRVRDSGTRRVKLCVDEVPLSRGVLDQGTIDELSRWCEAEVRKHGARFVDLQTTRARVDGVAREHPTLVRETVGALISLRRLTELLRRLVEEDVSIRNLRRILELVAEHGVADDNVESLLAVVREGLSDYLCFRYVDPNNRLRFFEVDRGIEDMLLGALRTSGTRSYVALGSKVSREIVACIEAEIRAQRGAGRRVVLVTEQPVRPHLRALIRNDLPDVVVLARQELAASVEQERAGWIAL